MYFMYIQTHANEDLKSIYHFILITTLYGIIILQFLQMKKLKLIEIKLLVPGHTKLRLEPLSEAKVGI